MKAKQTITITKDTRTENGWIEFATDDYQGQAKIYDEPSEYGINNGRISKLWIATPGNWRTRKPVFNYDRGADFDNMLNGHLEQIIKQLESL